MDQALPLGAASKHCELRLPLRRLTAFMRSSNHPSNRYRDGLWRNRVLGEPRGEDQNVIGATTSVSKGTKVLAVR